jgi:hypothetical protein
MPQNWKKYSAIFVYRTKRYIHEEILFKILKPEARFKSIWKYNYWGSGESLSGPGSTLDQTENLRNSLPDLFRGFNIDTIFDAPCGDLNWMNLVIRENPNMNFIGGDVVPEVTQFVESRYQLSNFRCLVFDITQDEFPKADIWLSRAVLYHLSNYDIYLSLERFVNSEIRYILTTNCVTALDHKNADIESGGWRSLNLKLPPFNFPDETLWEIDDSKDPHPRMKISMWSREQIELILPDLKSNLNK